MRFYEYYAERMAERMAKGQFDMNDLRQQLRQMQKMGGIGAIVANEIERHLLRETRVVVLGHLQRGGAPTMS